ncbi:hypothetical protein PENTCL1PPCAC_5403, partial [Pristionchus entomophagus]
SEHIDRKKFARNLKEQCKKIQKIIQSLESSLAANTTIDVAIKAEVQASTVRIELSIQSFLKALSKLQLVLSRGEKMFDHHVDSITEPFDRMQQAIISMPPLSHVAALEVIENGLHQLAIEDTRGHEVIKMIE